MIESTTADSLFDDIAQDVAREQAEVCRMIADDARQALSIDIERVGGRIIRSRPGEWPRRETRNLQETTYGDAIAAGEVIEAAVWHDAEYAKYLVASGRLSLLDIQDNYLDDQLDATVRGIKGT